MSATLVRARRGRPRLVADAETVPVTVRIPVHLHDDLVRHALTRRVPVAEVYREAAFSYSKIGPTRPTR
jgi:hypothetical protein